MELCKVCSVGISADRRAKFKLKGDAAGTKEVYLELFDSLMEKYLEYLACTAMNLHSSASPVLLFTKKNIMMSKLVSSV